ncbi:glycosyltransferase family 2 protein [Neobacillus muris]|uniref:glycosyltransferase family 2 protein n=1 Tax=Neobacillus muris TaxID=2941334 RepID=UPI0020417CE0|nr:glycosyltransferase [Neobacillus muris]
MNPKLSIIVPVYNVESYLNKCVDSILSQTFKDFELILVNDGSPDHCGAICDHYAERDIRVKVIHKKNGGLSSARNAGLDVAKGDYIGLIDSDDYIHEKMFEILLENARQHSSDIVVCDFIKVKENQYVNVNSSCKNGRVKHYSNIEALHQLFFRDENSYITNAGNNTKWVVVWNKIYKRQIFQGARFNEGRICEDEFIIHKLLYNSKKITAVSNQLYYYVQRPNSIMNTSYSIKRLDKVYALKDRVDFFSKIKEKKLHSLAYKSYLDTFFWNYYLAKNQLSNSRLELRLLKQTLNGSVKSLLNNPFFSWKQKLAVLAFMINPIIYELLVNQKSGVYNQ